MLAFLIHTREIMLLPLLLPIVALCVALKPMFVAVGYVSLPDRNP